jgi:tRNA(adenine34) deaminase
MSSEKVTPRDELFMAKALELAESALAQNEFPVGCIIATKETVVARGHRSGTASGAGNEIDHAEINALRELCLVSIPENRAGLTLYATMEPCLMCYSAILLSGIRRIVYAYEDVMGGGTGLDRSGLPSLYRDVELKVIPGVLRKDSVLLFQRFFSASGNDYWADSPLSQHALSQPT